MANKKFSTELEFDTAFRKAKPEFFYSGLVYFHKVKTDEGYVAEEAGIHYNAEFDQTQFLADAYSGLAYLPFSEMPEEPTDLERKVPEEGFMKEGELHETKTTGKEEKPFKQPKKAATKKKTEPVVDTVAKTAEIASQEINEENHQKENGESVISPVVATDDK